MSRAIDPRLKTVLQTFSRSWEGKRTAALAGLDFEDLRTRLAEARDGALDRMDELVHEFEDNARRQGSLILHASTGAEANALIRGILRDHGCETLAKSKSMVSEETGLNAFLVRNGLRPRETDLGEWIVQLLDAPPTHMVMPAIHLTRADVAAIFRDKLKVDLEADIPTLVRTARQELRREIFQVGAGLTGANALIAENGALMLVTNEGNGRLVTTVPPIHIVLASFDKVVPTTRDALLLLKLLTRNATGQTISSYVSFLAGPHHAAQYIILLDNHRSQLLSDPRFRSVLRCIKCSACLNVCPVYQVIGGQRFAHVYMGGIGSLLTAFIHGLRQSRAVADLCLVCHRCEQVCATKIEIAGLIRSLRERLVYEMRVPVWKEAVFNRILSRPAVQRRAFGLARAGRAAITGKDGFARRLPPPLRKFDRFRALPAPAKRSFSQLWAQSKGDSESAATKGEVTLFTGCLIEHFYPRIGLDAARVLNRLGYAVRPGPALCCGFPSANAGFTAAAGKAMAGILPGLSGDGPVVTLCPTCTHMLGRLGPELLGTEEARLAGKRVITFSQFMNRQDAKSWPALKGQVEAVGRLTYHDSCHHGFVLGAGGDSRALIRKVVGAEITEMDRSDACCGFAGSYAVSHPEISEALLADKLEAIRRTGAGTVALDCPGCLLQIRGGCRRTGLEVEVRHTAELLAQGLED